MHAPAISPTDEHAHAPAISPVGAAAVDRIVEPGGEPRLEGAHRLRRARREEARSSLDLIDAQWDAALTRLAKLVEWT